MVKWSKSVITILDPTLTSVHKSYPTLRGRGIRILLNAGLRDPDHIWALRIQQGRGILIHSTLHEPMNVFTSVPTGTVEYRSLFSYTIRRIEKYLFVWELIRGSRIFTQRQPAAANSPRLAQPYGRVQKLVGGKGRMELCHQGLVILVPLVAGHFK